MLFKKPIKFEVWNKILSKTVKDQKEKCIPGSNHFINSLKYIKMLDPKIAMV